MKSLKHIRNTFLPTNAENIMDIIIASNVKAVKKGGTPRMLIFRIRKKQFKF